MFAALVSVIYRGLGSSAPVAHAGALGRAASDEGERAGVVGDGGLEAQVADLVHAALHQRQHKLRQLWHRWHLHLRAPLRDWHLCRLCTSQHLCCTEVKQECS